MFQFKSIRTKFVLFISLLILLPVGIFVGIVIDLRLRSLSKIEDMNSTLITNALQAEWKKKVRSLATIMGKTLAQPMYALDIYEMHYLARLAMEGESFSYVYVQDKEGRVLVDATEGSNLVGEVLNDPLSKRSLAAEDLIIQRDKQTDIVDIAVPIIIGKTKIGIVRIGYSLEEIQKTIFTMTSKVSDNIGQSIKKSIRNTIFLLIVIIVPAFVFGSFFVRSLVKPIKRLVQGTEKIAKGDLNTKVPVKSNDEIGLLSTSFNEMVGNLKEAKLEINKFRYHLETLVEERTKELKDSQEQLLRSQKMAAVGQVSSGIAHELRNPLATMQMSLYYLSTVLKDADDKVKKHLTLIHDNVLLSNNIITSLLGLTRARTLSLVKSDVNRAVKNVLKDIKTVEGITINTQLGENLPAIPLDLIQILSVFKNIISNALQAMPEGGSLDIKTEVKGDFVGVEFHDTGVGISKENIQKIYEPLFTTKAKGIGIGLTLVKTIIDEHNGSISVESEIGKGTTFTLRFPIATETTQEKVLPGPGQKT